MGRILFFIGLGIVLYALLRIARMGRAEKGTKKKMSRRAVDMCECPVCGTHFPSDEAVLGDGVKFCSEACRSKSRGKEC